MKSTKSQIQANLRSILENTLEEARREYLLAKESRDSDTKSSAGDKFETGREMMQREMDKLSALVDNTLNSIAKLDRIADLPASVVITENSLVETDQETYFISIGYGKLDTIYAISIESPLGLELKGKRVGDRIEMRGRNITIKSIL
jgi:transcription elongation GreA/GreB family factor